MGIVNVTPDSFSDGGEFFDHEKAIEHGLELIRDGADVLDIGGESTRPGAEEVPLEEELRRVIPVVEGLAGRSPGFDRHDQGGSCPGGGRSRARRSSTT